jgi:hypothetical protein
MSSIEDLTQTWREMSPAAWAEHAYGWIMPDGKPITLTDWQRAALDAWWQHRLTTTCLAVSNTKKTGKTMCNGVLLAWRWLTMPGEHFVAANDLDQSSGRQFRMISDMAKRHPILKKHTRITRLRLTFGPTDSTLEALGTDAAGNAGANHHTVSHTESWGILYEAGVRSFEELAPPPGLAYGLPALRIADSYAGYTGESKTWHDLIDRGLAGDLVGGDWPVYKAGGLLLFHMDGAEAQERCFRGTPAQAKAYYTDQLESLRATAYSRQHLNERASGESQFVGLTLWDKTVDPDCRPLTPGDMRPVFLGADAATKRDFVGLVGCTWNPERKRTELVYVRKWDPKLLPKLAAGVDLDGTVGREISRLHREHNVQACRFDPWQMASIMNRLQKAGVKVIEFPQGAQRTQSDQLLYDAITSKSLTTFPSPALREAIRCAAAKDGPRGFRLQKRPGDDLAVALSMAHFGASGDSGGPAAGETVDIPIEDYYDTRRRNKPLWQRQQTY